MTTIDAKNKTTTELAIWLEGLSTSDTVYYTEYPNFDEAAKRLRAQEARIAELTKDAAPKEEVRKQMESETFEEYDWFYKLKFICRVLGNNGNAPKEDWQTAHGMAKSLFNSAWLVQGLAAANTHPPAPDYTDLLKMIAHRARSFPNFPLGHHITEVFAAIGEEPPEPAPAPKAITADMVTDEMVKTSVFVNVFNAKQQIANVVNAFNRVNP